MASVHFIVLDAVKRVNMDITRIWIYFLKENNKKNVTQEYFVRLHIYHNSDISYFHRFWAWIKYPLFWTVNWRLIIFGYFWNLINENHTNVTAIIQNIFDR